MYQGQTVYGTVSLQMVTRSAALRLYERVVPTILVRMSLSSIAHITSCCNFPPLWLAARNMRTGGLMQPASLQPP
jgi:hypothetical protein